MSDSNTIETDKNVQIGDSISNREKKSRKDKSKSSTKVVIRRLPPSMDEETFLNQIQPIPEYDYFYFVTADWSLGQNASSRAYINFVNDEDIFIFKDRFDGYVFVEAKGGVEYPAIVEFAPFQGLPKSKSRKRDNKCNTIETDPDFIKFMTFLNGEIGDVKPEMKMEYSYQIKDEKKITSTPLLEYIANKKLERREDRKKKIDERKRQRDDDRNRKKNQVAKAIPSSIREQDDDGIIVRVVKSRPRDRGDRMKKDRNSEPSSKPSSSDVKQNKSESNRDEKRRLEREQRENKRKEERQRFRDERDQKRQAERDRIRKERENNKKEEIKTEKSSTKSDLDGPNKGNQKDDRVKRYSESRRARMENKEQNDSSNTGADASDKSANSSQIDKHETEQEKSISAKYDGSKDAKEKVELAAFTKSNEEEKSKSTEDAKNNDDSSGDNGKESSSKLTKEERLARRIRNKDRPSLQIYQPGQGKRRMSAKKDDEKSADESPKILSKPSSPTLSENSITFSADKPNSSSKKVVVDKMKNDKPANVDRVKSQGSKEKSRSEKWYENSKYQNRKQGQASGKSNQTQDDTTPAERKVSRYSERRNKIKEKQTSKVENAEIAIEAVQVTDQLPASNAKSDEIDSSDVK